MKFKKFFALVIAVIMLCAMVVSVGAANPDTQRHTIYHNSNGDTVAVARYSLYYNSYMNCVRATNEVTYYTARIDVSQRNFSGYIKLNVQLNIGRWEDEKAAYLMTTGSSAAFNTDDYYIPAGRTLSQATASFRTNQRVIVDGQTYEANQNYTEAYTTNDLIVP